MNSGVDKYFSKDQRWQKEIEKLRTIILSCDLDEGLKWGCPCYMYDNSNVVLIHVFKEYCALLFFKGALLKDTKNILIRQTENVHSARQIRFTTLQEITKLASTLKAYINEAIEVEKAGLSVDPKTRKKLDLPEELQSSFKKTPALKKAFSALTPGRQRAYTLYFSQAKQSKTRESRIEKYAPHILKGKGLND